MRHKHTFVEGTVVWSKIRGFPWWPAIVEKSIKNGKNYIKFIGDGSKGIVPYNNICSFDDGISNGYSNIKKRKLLVAFEEAKMMNEFNIKMNKTNFDLKLNENKDEIDILTNYFKNKQKILSEINNLNSLLLKFSNYLKYIAKNLNKEVELNEKEMLLKIFNYLKKFKINDPINNLNETKLGIIIEYLSYNFKSCLLKNAASEVNEILKNQVIDEMFQN